MSTLAVAVAVTSTSFAASGAALLLRRRATTAAVLMVASGTCGLVAALLADRPGWVPLVIVAAQLLAPLALATYPTPRWRHPADFLTLAVLAGGGAVSAASTA